MRLTTLAATPQSKTKGNVLTNALEALEGQDWLDGPAAAVRKAVRALPLGRARDALHGVWLGHPLHPVLVQLPMGAWTCAGILDLIPGQGRPARLLVSVGLASAVPAAVAGWVDWSEQRPRQARVGLIHAAANITAVTAYAGSLAARFRGRPVLGRALGFGGMTVATVGGLLGGHLAYRQGAGVNHAEAVPVLVEPGWHRIGIPQDFPVGEPVRRMADEVAVVVIHDDDGRLYALADRCSHMDGPLHEGKVLEGCIECPWHGSQFRISDGENVTGPAIAPQPRFDCRISPEGHVEVRIARA
ncbi:Rieske 2Fe-2S domain-containing protein [Streptomyces sp. NPDC046977]|uniref:Rieske 2Fe-2S domain-containing protein n=1 Tax=Streptomyces sp. NPDC046977 TaxID=3154703 RepID=UPI0033FA7CCF